ncbi:protein of unknown function [Magnetospirillum gryphiswaldense MSR-1 v2]|uniref:Uncharacterized protein n=1 Tax=Magnetospirillum gryphiswaldense (strain DSM 6361 / JCM 21280 / NBRC 15271 / MSR-1) TaxID=431944 RepID=V6F442_MAGGM|nr:protein of unknown function [Magnetospirillum gryphiswaldense MSR-1 v2]
MYVYLSLLNINSVVWRPCVDKNSLKRYIRTYVLHLDLQGIAVGQKPEAAMRVKGEPEQQLTGNGVFRLPWKPKPVLVELGMDGCVE